MCESRGNTHNIMGKSRAGKLKLSLLAAIQPRMYNRSTVGH